MGNNFNTSNLILTETSYSKHDMVYIPFFNSSTYLSLYRCSKCSHETTQMPTENKKNCIKHKYLEPPKFKEYDLVSYSIRIKAVNNYIDTVFNYLKKYGNKYNIPVFYVQGTNTIHSDGYNILMKTHTIEQYENPSVDFYQLCVRLNPKDIELRYRIE